MRDFNHGDMQHVTKKPPCNTNLEVHVKNIFMFTCAYVYIRKIPYPSIFGVALLQCCTVRKNRGYEKGPRSPEKEGA